MLPAAIPGSGPGVAQANAAMDCIALWGLSDLAGLLNHPAHPPPGDLMDPSDTRQMLLDLDFTGLPDSSSEGTVEPNGFANAAAESQSALQQLGIQHCLEQSPPTLRPRRDTPHDKEKNDFFDKTRQEVKAQADAFIRGRLSQHLPGHKLPLAKVKTIISKHSCDTPLYIGAGVPAGLAGMGEIFIRWLTKLSYQNAEREKRTSLKYRDLKEAIGNGSQFDFLLPPVNEFETRMLEKVDEGGRVTMDAKRVREVVEQRHDIFAGLPLDGLPIDQLFAGHVDVIGRGSPGSDERPAKRGRGSSRATSPPV